MTSLEESIQKKEIEALINTVSVADPSLKDKLNTAVIWNYLQMPDNSFGWTTSATMPTNVKLMAIAAHIQAGAKPGFGHIYFLGNKLYQSADFVRQQANANPDWKITGEPKFKPHAIEEKDMFGLEKGDLSCKCIITVIHQGTEFTAEGDGIIGLEELKFRSQKGHPKPGLNGKKNIAMTLKTRAMRDLYSRFYPSRGMPIGPDQSEEQEVIEAKYEEQLKINKTETTEVDAEKTREVIQIEEAKVEEEDNKKEALDALNEIIKQSKEKGMKPKDLWSEVGLTTKKDFLNQDSQKIFDCLEILTDFVDNFDCVKDTAINHLELAKERYTKQVDSVKEKGGLPMKILGFNHLNIFESQDIKEVTMASGVLVEWLKNPTVEVKEDPLNDFSDQPEEIAKPEEGKKAYDIIERLKVHEQLKDEKTRSKLVELSQKRLKEGDDILIVKIARLANKGNYSELDSLISDRQAL